jgi:acyl-CoA reductase-like NAD-dependent aldehyde dehydrogenase
VVLTSARANVCEVPRGRGADGAVGVVIERGAGAAHALTQRAADARADERWGELPLRVRLGWVKRFESLVAGHEADLCRAIAEDIGKPEWQSLTGDILALLFACRWVRRRGKRVLRERRIGASMALPGVNGRVKRVPLGEVAIIATWNYPVQLLGIELLHALAAGNRVTVKPSEHSPRSQILLLELAFKALQQTIDGEQACSGMDAGRVLRWVEATREAGAALLTSRKFDHVLFTGSTAVGRKIAETLAPSLTSSTLELSGRDSAFVLDDADPALAARCLWTGVTMNAGQTCMAPRRVLVHEKVYSEFLRFLSPLAAGEKPVRLIDERAAAEVYEQCREAMMAGARSLSGIIEPPMADASGKARLLRPLAMVDCPADARLAAGAHFGPAFAVVRVSSVDEALAIHRGCDQHLSASIYTRDAARANELAMKLGATIVNINDTIMPTAHPQVGLGGHGASGWGVTRGEEGLLAMTRPVYVTRTRLPARPGLEPPDAKIVAKVRRFVAWFFG